MLEEFVIRFDIMDKALDINYHYVSKSDRCIVWASAIILNVDSIRYVLNTWVSNIFTSVLIINLFLVVICWLPILYSFIKSHEPLRTYNWFIPVLVLFLFIFTLIYDPNSYNSIVLGWGGFYRAFDRVFFPIQGVVVFFLVTRLSGADAVKYWLTMTVIMSFIINAWQPLAFSSMDSLSTVVDPATGREMEVSYSANFGYGLSILMLFCVFHGLVFNKKRLFFLIMSLFCVVEILLYGNRGVFLQLAFLLLLYLLNAGGISSNSKTFNSIIILIIIVLLWVIYQFWTEMTLAISALGIESRTLESILEETATDSNGREDIYEDVIKLIKENGIMGGGVYSSITKYKFYAHNFFLDILADYGYVFGGCLLLFFFISIIKAFKKFSLHDYLFPFVVCFSFTFGKLMVTNYYMYENYFWACLAIVVLGMRKCRRTKHLSSIMNNKVFDKYINSNEQDSVIQTQ